MPLPNPGMDFNPFDTLPAAQLDDLVENIEALAAGSGLDQNSVSASALSINAILLGNVTRTANVSTSTTDTLITGLSSTITIPSGGRSIEVTACVNLTGGNAGAQSTVKIWDGAVGVGTVIATGKSYTAANNVVQTVTAVAVATPAAGSKTYEVSASTNTGTGTVEASATQPASLTIKLI